MKLLDEFLDVLSKGAQDARPVDWVIIGICLAAYLPTLWIIKATNGKGQSTLSWALWFALDITQFIGTLGAKGGNSAALFGFCIGSLFCAVFMIKYKKGTEWDLWSDTLTFAMVIMCMVIWIFADKDLGVLMSSNAQIIAGIPFLRETRKNPEPLNLIPVLGFFTANLLTLIYAKSLSIYEPEHWLFSAFMILFGGTIVYYLIKELFRRKKPGIFTEWIGD